MIPSLPVAEDREILSMLIGGSKFYAYGRLDPYDQISGAYHVAPALARTLIPMAARTGRCFLPHDKDETDLTPLVWDDGDPWRFTLEIQEIPHRSWLLTGGFRRGEQRMDLATPLLVTPGGLLFAPDHIAALAEETALPWITNLRKGKPITIPFGERDEFLAELLSSPIVPALDLPPDLHLEEVTLPPRPCLKISRQESRYGPERMKAELSFEYDGQSVPEGTPAQGFYQASTRRFVRRDLAAEQAATALLGELGLQSLSPSWQSEASWNLPPAKLPRVVRALAESGWHIVAEGKVFRNPTTTRAEVTSGVDWFELHGEVEYGGARAQLPQLLQALKRGETMVTLDDGTYGLLPEEWLSRFGAVAAMGDTEGDHIRFSSTQAGLLDALLATQPTVQCDETFHNVRKQLDRFQQIAPAQQPDGFVGELRGYQREGLGWMQFLRRFPSAAAWPTIWAWAKPPRCWRCSNAAASCARRRARPALAGRRAPLAGLQLEAGSRALHAPACACSTTPASAAIASSRFSRLTTSSSPPTAPCAATPPHSKISSFDYVILDEAQAIKNADTRIRQSRPPAARRPSPRPQRHARRKPSRRAVELFEFLNPGMLGTSSAFQTHRRRRCAIPTKRPATLLSARLAPLHPPPHQGPGRQRTAGQARADHLLRTGAAPAHALRRTARALPPVAARQASTPRAWASPRSRCSKPCCACARPPAIPALIDPKRSEEPSAKLDMLARNCAKSSTKATRRWSSRSSPACSPSSAERSTSRASSTNISTARPATARQRVERFQNRPQLPALPDQPQSRRPRPQPHRRRIRLPPRPLVEPRRRGPGRSTAPTASARPARSSPIA